jgi:quinol monooxygenase YgiN
MAKVIVQHHVQDFGAWKPAFDEHGEVRRQHGATGHTINRTIEDPNNLVVVNNFASIEGAKAFMTDPSLKDVMSRAGVDSAPQVWLVEESETVSY